ncbi:MULTISPECIES: serine hydrolase [unclassified Arcicella]|uniref:serine hydrolase domain-containing protein n=1 Tax=unclassified Arcicella TaxID=2644986 RepID=UPI002865AEBE|nr:MULTISPECIES: serine hydrolase [unclassified Arcicella]MDR6562782.1 CubicO group peptidase (beta-lactamase class C family) [Arcicella sp. BE51]MDR6812874.1 CubicO group peptidase (beta-lactamase class C family) [Arcicella sp. BE140]MDR6824188.1 CubicO group peptidase (beta-lactamase class C family) [Arcicella sp. BE139]
MKKNILFICLIISFTSISSFSQVNKTLLDSLTIAIEHGAYPNIDGIVVSQKGKLIYEKYFNGLTQSSLHDTRSSFKSITGLLVGIAIDKGYIKSVNEKVYSFFPEYKDFKNWDSRKDGMTVQHLLAMKSGFDCEEWDGAKDCEDEMAETKDWVKFSLDLPMSHPSGTHWAYTSCNTMILGGIVANASKMSILAFADKFLFQPLGIKNYRWTKDPSGHGMTAGSFYILPSDMAKIGELVLNKGMYKGKRIVSEKWIKEATQPITKIENFSNVSISKAKSAIPQPTFYGYTWYNEEIRTDKIRHNVIFASGNGGQYIMVIPDLALVVAFTGNSYNSSKSKLPFAILIKYILPYFEGG